MPDGFVIRDAVPGDRDAVLSFWPHPDRFDRRLASSVSGEESLLVAVHGDLTAGIVGIRWDGGCDDAARPLLYALEIRAEQRGRGGGTALIRHVAGLVADRGFAELTLEVEVANAGAIRLYHRLGFVTAGPHRHVWHSGKSCGIADVLIMHGGAGDLARR
ncbi:GNAT family N-acetyltransferase [Actinoplanes derwentensis]|uniref:Ribosomal-protein-alanine N-acetyltransferase n=1 Tax=Actinoplanes derwentensis TaxID=113562 RepID=A0A1H2DAI6_9ACTN|nr:GNAT family N-acetyltransferase [Actinoplanes derwentensis]GID81753.1 hypothetical protein Ade03nite_06770 [Actinoplanes derwentensis]SDT79765.1 ribosomal-protein-alanine N-acetyltransferase [Actinoplanes derwentensis]